MPVPIVYRKNSESNVSYSFYDIASGTGYQRFYLGGAGTSGANVLFIAPQAIASTSGTGTSFIENAAGGIVTSNFDLPFNKTMTMGGEALFEYTMYLAATRIGWVSIHAYHVNSAAAETSLGYTTSNQPTAGGSGNTYRMSLKLTIAPKTFSKGEKLRLKVSLFVNAALAYCYTDPADIEDTPIAGIPSTFIADIPFVIDL